VSLAETEELKKPGRRISRRGDRVFSGLVTAAGLVIVVALAGVALFLLYKGYPALTAAPAELPGGLGFWSFVWPLLFGTLLSSAIALVLGTPLAIGIALFVTFYSPRRLAGSIGFMIDLLAAVPSVVFGLWGANFLGPRLVPLYEWLAEHASWIPFFAGPASATGRTMMTAGIILAIMIVPIVTALSREVFQQAPHLQREAALALGATRWEMIRGVVLPFGRSGVVSATMLGLGRALGETMAVAMVLSVSGVVTFNLISPSNPSTIAANIALNFPESTGLAVNALIATGLVLFVITFVVNLFARVIVRRVRSEG
jgi:phosphate transport system permease protein